VGSGGPGSADRRSEAWAAGEGRLLILACAGYLVISALLFGEFILGSAEGRIASSGIGDMTRYFAFMREIVANEWAAGNVALWNPHSFSGTPLLGAFQPSNFYLPNFHYVFLPLPLSIDLELSLHVALLGSTTFLWLRGWRLDFWACFFGGCVAALGGASFLRVLAGQVTVLDTLAWSPLVLWAVDRLEERPSVGPVLAGSAAVSLMILAGHPPTFFMCGVVTALYCVPALLGSESRGRLLIALAIMAVAPLGLAAVQLWTGLEMAGQGVRSGGMPFEFASSFSLPPENLLTLLAPEMLGEATLFKRSYFGRWFYWDTSVYFGAIALVLAVHGAVTGRSSLRARACALFAITLVLALGAYTPVYEWIYAFVPGFDHVRAPSKFGFHVGLFGAALAAIGLHRLMLEPARVRAGCVTAALLAVVTSVLAIWAWQWPPGSSDHSLPQLLGSFNDQRELLPVNYLRWNKTLLDTLHISLAFFSAAAILLFLSPRWPRAVPLLIALGVAELLLFAFTNRGGTRVGAEYLRRPGLPAAYQRAGEDRVLLLGKTSNIAMQMHRYDLWGYEPIGLGRYARFMARTQGRPVETLNNIGGAHPDRFHPLFAVLRGGYSVDGQGELTEHPGAWPRFGFAREHRVIADPEAALEAMFEPGFDPRVPILESLPEPAPDLDGSGGSARLLDESTDHLDVAVELDSPAILLIADAYAEGWRVRDLDDDRLGAFEVQPANSVMRAIALPAGQHRLRVEYSPLGYRAGGWASSVSLLAWAGTAAWWLRRRSIASGDAGG
jgi:hypothetical protein